MDLARGTVELGVNRREDLFEDGRSADSGLAGPAIPCYPAVCKIDEKKMHSEAH